MKTIWKWVKDKAAWIVIAFFIVFSVLFGSFLSSRKVERRKKEAKKKIEGAKKLGEKATYYDGVESGLHESEFLLDSQIEGINEESKKTKKEIGEMDAQEVADRFNALYDSDSRSN